MRQLSSLQSYLSGQIVGNQRPYHVLKITNIVATPSRNILSLNFPLKPTQNESHALSTVLRLHRDLQLQDTLRVIISTIRGDGGVCTKNYGTRTVRLMSLYVFRSLVEESDPGETILEK